MKNNKMLTIGAGLIAVAVVAVFAPVAGFDFINLDDDEYVYANAWIRQGVTLAALKQAFTGAYSCNWHPLTWVSHMLDIRLFGLWAGGHHLTNLFIHTAACLALVAALFQLTGALGPSLLAGILFGIHPLHVESVAWVSERKDLLCGLFFILGLSAWGRWAERGQKRWYLATAASLVAALMSKPMAVTFPLVLLVLDFWPLNRLGRRSVVFLVAEKLPLCAISAAAALLTFAVQKGCGAVVSLDLPLAARAANATIAVTGYLVKTLWPLNLAVYYPYPKVIALWQVAGAGVALVLITWLGLRLKNRHPYLLAGWLWYLITLVPVIGLVQVGMQAAADRYTYLPLIGIFMAFGWSLRTVWQWRPTALPYIYGALVVGIAALALTARWQLSRWADSVTLFTHTLAVTADNDLAHYNLAVALADRGDSAGAVRHYALAAAINGRNVQARNNLAAVLIDAGRIDEALVLGRQALAIDPANADAHCNLGMALYLAGQPGEAVTHLEKALALNPGHVEAANNLGVIKAAQGDSAAAIGLFETVLRLAPGHRQAAANLKALIRPPPE